MTPRLSDLIEQGIRLSRPSRHGQSYHWSCLSGRGEQPCLCPIMTAALAAGVFPASSSLSFIRAMARLGNAANELVPWPPGLTDLNPDFSPARPEGVVLVVVELYDRHRWGRRRIAKYLRQCGL